MKSISTRLADSVVPGLNLDPADAVSLQTIAPTCASIEAFDPIEGGSRKIVYEMFTGVRVLRGTVDTLKRFNNEEVESYVLATIEASFYVSYDEVSLGQANLDDECLEAFGKANVPHNLWPYWREVVQSVCSRMGLPRLILPPHRLRKSALTSNEASEPKAPS